MKLERIKNVLMFLALVMLGCVVGATEFHVAKNGGDSDAGTRAQPFLTIQAAANFAQPGDIITVHKGIYRERVNPPRGGISNDQRIVYQAAPGEQVVITGAEIVTGWKKAGPDVWKMTLPNSFFGNFNPYTNELSGAWFLPEGRVHHTGAVYLNGNWLREASPEI